MLTKSSTITPHLLALRARINWFDARDVLRELATQDRVTTLRSGRFGPPVQPSAESG
jgi:ribosomal protein S25